MLEKLNQIKSMNDSSLSKGLYQYLVKQKQFIYDSFTLLSEEHKKMYENEFNELKKSLENIDE